MLNLGMSDMQWMLLFSVLLVTALVTNIILVWTVVSSKSCAKPTNAFMLNVGLANIVQMGVFVPIYIVYVMRGTWDLGDELCKIYQFFPRFTISVGALALLALTSHVYLSDTPHLRIYGWKICLIVLGILLPWLYGFGISFPWVWYSKANNEVCKIYLPHNFPFGVRIEGNSIAYHWINISLIYFVPMITIFCMIVPLMVRLCKGRAVYINKVQRTHRAITQMTIMADLFFIACSFPFTITSTYLLYHIHEADLHTLYTVFPATVFLDYTQTTIRPLVFFAMNPDLRRDFRIACKCSCVDDEPDDWGQKNGEAPLFQVASTKEY